ncbi:MAG: UDP-4-amino-4,6-dideoxy-N-acetyl-beta-L-altrosamine transaminase [Candidatus Nealsonbacteria bacterium]|nr:UDP-4-amino-4,6-dideoxy-N-acetyl-beta-L-altrosamine transaminase [Candidatus Nealsonbacteria bacterium]
MKKFIPYSHQWINEEDIKEVVGVLRSDWITQGSKVEEFEKLLAKYCKAKYALAVSSGTAALHLAYLAAGIKPGDEVVTTPLTFAATSNCLVHCGGKPVFSDVEEDTLNINPELVEGLISHKTRAISVVDFAGHPCNLDEIKKTARKHSLLVIEDASHALGAEYKRRRVGALADLTVFSFHPVKLITSGEGGAVLTDRKDFYEKMKTLRNHGIVKRPEKGGWYYEIESPGFNYRITDIQSALAVSQMKNLEKFLRRRREIANFYNKAFGSVKELTLPVQKSYAKSAWHIYPVRLNLEKLRAGRRKIFEAFQKEGLGVQVHYMPLHLHPYYKKRFGYKLGDFPVAEKYYQRAITLPLFPRMTREEAQQVVKTVKKAIIFYK